MSWATYATVETSGALDTGHYGGDCPTTGCGGSHAQWGLSATSLTESSSSGTATLQTYDANRTWYQHKISLTGLKPATKYFYRVGDPATGWSRVFSFESLVDASTLAANLPQTHLLFGDLGSKCAFSMGPNCNCSMISDCARQNASLGIISEVFAGDVKMILQVGDFAYDMGTANGYYGDQFFDLVEDVAATVPFMVSIGNHEGGGSSLARYTESFAHMPQQCQPGDADCRPTVNSTNGEAPNDWWYSWDSGLVHYIAVNTNLPGDAEMWVEQWKFVEADLKRVNAQRSKTPWVIVHGHQSMYCSCDGDCDQAASNVRDGPFGNGTYGLEELFFKQGVDLFINGHEHECVREGARARTHYLNPSSRAISCRVPPALFRVASWLVFTPACWISVSAADAAAMSGIGLRTRASRSRATRSRTPRSTLSRAAPAAKKCTSRSRGRSRHAPRSAQILS